jgi:hypothetical protein
MVCINYAALKYVDRYHGLSPSREDHFPGPEDLNDELRKICIYQKNIGLQYQPLTPLGWIDFATTWVPIRIELNENLLGCVMAKDRRQILMLGIDFVKASG